MSNSPRVSVIISFLNSELFLGESVESVYAQSFSDWELLLVDDGSTDHSTDIALEYRDKDPERVFYLEHDNHENKGISASRNLGVCNARGKYIATLDADDVWVKHKLEQQVEILEAYPEAGMVCGDTKYWHGWTGNPADIERDHYMYGAISLNTLRLNTLVNPPTPLLLNLNEQLDTVSMSNIMLRKEVIEQVGGFEDDFTGMHEDQAFQAKIYLNSPVYFAEPCWDLYRQHRDSCYYTAMGKGQYISTELFYLLWLEKYFKANNITNPELSNVLQRRIWNFKHPASNKFRRTITVNFKKFVTAAGIHLLSRSDWEYLISTYNGKRYNKLSGWVDPGEPETLKSAGESRHDTACTSLDQYYIYRFLKENSTHIRGKVLEIGTDRIAHQYGHENVIKSDLVNKPTKANTKPGKHNIIDFASDIPSNTYDCIIVAHKLQTADNLSPEIKTLHRILKPDGVVLAIMKGIGTVADEQTENTDRDRQVITSSVRKLFEEHFPDKDIDITSFGNISAVKNLLVRLVSKESTQRELDHSDNGYGIVIGVRAVKSSQ